MCFGKRIQSNYTGLQRVCTILYDKSVRHRFAHPVFLRVPLPLLPPLYIARVRSRLARSLFLAVHVWWVVVSCCFVRSVPFLASVVVPAFPFSGFVCQCGFRKPTEQRGVHAFSAFSVFSAFA